MSHLVLLKRLRFALERTLRRFPFLRPILRLVRWLYRGVFLALALNVMLSVIQTFLANGVLPTPTDITHSFLIRIAARLALSHLLLALTLAGFLGCILITGFFMDVIGVQLDSIRVDSKLPEAARVDWGPAKDMPFFLGRERSLAQVRRWVLRKRCRLVAVLGIGGIGKTQFTYVLAKRYLAGHFDFILWLSLEGGREASKVLLRCIKHFSGQRQVDIPDDPEEQVLLLLKYFREHRCLLVLDNFESVFDGRGANGPASQARGDAATYGTLLRRVGEAGHQSCLIITSRENPEQVAVLDGRISSVHTLTLAGLSDEDGQRLLENHGLTATREQWHQLIGHYSGNPTALNIVGARILGTPFSGSVARYLAQGDTMPKGVGELIESQLRNLSGQEHDVLFWLAIEQEEVTVDRLQQDLLWSGEGLVDNLATLQSRSLVQDAGVGRVTLLPVVREYLLRRLVEHVLAESESGQLDLLDSHALIQSQAKEYIRQRQEHDILQPLIRRLIERFGVEGAATLLQQWLQSVREHPERWRGYAAGNLINLLVHLGVDLRGADFSGMVVRQADLRGVLLPGVSLANADVATSTFTEAFATIQAVAYSPDMAFFAGGTYQGEIRVWRTSDGTLQRSFQGHESFIRSVAFSPDGSLLASGGDDKTVRLWDLNNAQGNKVLRGHTDFVWSIAFSPDGSLVTSSSDDHTVRIWNTGTGECEKVLRGHSARVWCVAFHPNGTQVASGSDDQDIRLWSVRSGRCTKRLRGYNTTVFGLSFSHSGALLAAARDNTGDGNSLQVWNVRAGRVVKQLQGHTDWVWGVAFSHDDRLLASSSADSTARLWDVASGQCVKTLTGHTGWVYSPRFSHDDAALLTSGDDRTVRLWDVRSGECIRSWVGYMNGVLSLAFSPDNTVLAAGRNDNTVELWDAALGQRIRTLSGHTDWIAAVAFSPDGGTLASASEDFTIRLWPLPDGSPSTVLTGHANRVAAIAFAPDGSILASGSDDRTIRLWRMPGGEFIRTLDGHDDEVYSVAFHPDGGLLATGSADETIRIWDLTHDTPPVVLSDLGSDVYDLAFSPSGQWLASAGADGTIRMWAVEGYQCRAVLTAHTGGALALAFSPDSARLASCGMDRNVKVWDVTSDTCIARLEGHTQLVNTVAFAGTTGLLASGSDDGTIRLWTGDTFDRAEILAVERPYEGMRIARTQGLSPAQISQLTVLGAVEV